MNSVEMARNACANKIIAKFKDIFFVMDRLNGDRYISYWENTYGETIRAFSDNITSISPNISLELLVKKPLFF